jgi:hypothetical protein
LVKSTVQVDMRGIERGRQRRNLGVQRGMDEAFLVLGMVGEFAD